MCDHGRPAAVLMVYFLRHQDVLFDLADTHLAPSIKVNPYRSKASYRPQMYNGAQRIAREERRNTGEPKEKSRDQGCSEDEWSSTSQTSSLCESVCLLCGGSGGGGVELKTLV